MSNIKIGIVEDDKIYSTLLQYELKSMDYSVLSPCVNYDEAVEMMNNEAPDLMILDINLEGEKRGIEIANYIRKHFSIPFIFLTGGGSRDLLDEVKLLKPSAFLVKPFKQMDLQAAIEIAINNFTLADRKSNQNSNEETKNLHDFIFIKDGDYFYKVKLDDICFINSENVYVMVNTNEKKFLVRASLNDYIEKLEPSKFVRVHQRYAINIDKIDKINTAYLLINKQEIPISKTYKSDLMKRLNLE